MEQVINEIHISKKKLEDENYVKELIKKIEKRENVQKTISLIINCVAIISILTIIGIPVGILLINISGFVSKHKDKIKEKDLDKIMDCIDKSIDKLNKEMNKIDDENQKGKIRDIIDKLNRNNNLLKTKGGIRIKVNNIFKTTEKVKFNYILRNENIDKDDFIKLTDKDIDFILKEMNFIKNRKNKKLYGPIEIFAANNLKTKKDVLNYIKTSGAYNDKSYNDIIEDYGEKVKKALKNKSVSSVYAQNDDIEIVYVQDTDKFYRWYIEDTDDIEEININDILKESKTLYDLTNEVLDKYNKNMKSLKENFIYELACSDDMDLLELCELDTLLS